MQRGINSWEGGIKATGGAIRPDKSFVYPISFDWDEHGAYEFHEPDPETHPLTVRNEFNVEEDLEQVSPSRGYETLGVFLAPDGSQNDQFEILKTKANKWADQIRSGHLPAQEAWQCISSTIIKTMEYPLPASMLSERQCDKLHTILKSAGLPHSTVCRKLPKDLVHGSPDSLGLGI